MRYNDIIITSRQNPLVCECALLQKKRERDRMGRFILDGAKLCYEYIRYVGAPVHLFVMDTHKDAYDATLSMLEHECSVDITVTLVGESAFMKMTEQKSPDGILLVGEISKISYEFIEAGSCFNFSDDRIIAMSSLRDTGNVGTVIRTALALGYDRVLMSSDCADIFSPKTLRATMGAAFNIKLSVCESLSEVVSALISSGRHVYSAELRENAVSLDSISIQDTDVFIVGNEGHGIELSVSEASSGSVYIPISERSESLNAAVAASVLMWHQRTVSF